MRLRYLSLLALVLLLSCHGNSVYRQLDTDFEENRWQRSDIKTYDFKIEKDGNYNLSIVFSHVAGIQFSQIPLQLELSADANIILAENIILRTTDAQGNDIGDCSGDYCDMEQTVFESKALKAGVYKVRLANAFDNAYLPNVLGVGINVTDSKTK